MSKVRPRPPRPWRPYHVLIGFYCVPTTLYKVLTASTQFLEDVVGTWLVWRGFNLIVSLVMNCFNSSAEYLSVVLISNGKGQFSTTHSGKTPEPILINLIYRTAHWRLPGMQTVTAIRRHSPSFPLSFFSFLFCVLCQARRSHCTSDLDQWGLKTRRSAQGSAFWGS